jgi:hypothetical protein
VYDIGGVVFAPQISGSNTDIMQALREEEDAFIDQLVTALERRRMGRYATAGGLY